MATLSLRISIPEKNLTKMMQFNPSTSVYDTCRIIKEKVTEAISMEPSKDFGLFLSDEDAKKGVWLESGRSLDYYLLRNGDLLEFRKKLRTLRVRMLDGTLKTILVDDSQPVANLMVVICTRIGITNHDEYSLVREVDDEDTETSRPGNFGTLTLKKRREEKGDRDIKMDLLRKKLKTDDEVNWIDPNKTLREQGIDETETVLLRRKYFFSDQNIDSRDPVQLSLLYVQARDAILDGTHPVTQDQAIVFAGVQCQIQFGDHKEEKHKSGFLELKEFLPHSYLKVKGIEKKIFIEHKKYSGLSELESKVLYTKTARSLNTYGVTFFLVKEKMKGKNKLVPRLLGVTKDSVLRLDEKTKEILKTWPLTTVRRWGASPNTFTLDFGDYSDQYYSVQTTEAEQILQLISGYIDIILKKQKSKDHFGIEGDEGSTMIEDSVSPLKATIMQHETPNLEKGNMESVSVAIPAVVRAGVDGARPYGTGYMSAAQYTTISRQVNVSHAPSTIQQPEIMSVMSEPQHALISTIVYGKEVIQIAENELFSKAEVPELGHDTVSLRWIEQAIDTHKQNIGSQIAAMNAATAQVVTLTSAPIDNVDHAAVSAAITTITNNLPEMTKGVRMIAALLDDEPSGDKLLDAARKLCSAFSDLLKATEPETKESRQTLLVVASRIGEASHQVLLNIGEEDSTSRELQDILLSLAKSVANTTAALVLKAKNIAATYEESTIQNQVISAATNCALATSQLVACAKVVAPTLNSPACQTQLMNAIREVTRAVENLVKVCNGTCFDEELLKELSGAAADVTKALNDLLSHIKIVTCGDRSKESPQECALETILSATDKLFANSGSAGEMIRQARIVGQATAQLIQSIKGDAEIQTDSEQQRKLLAAAKKLADATAKMVEAARQCASSPHDVKMQNNLRQAVEELREITTAAASPAVRRSLIYKLEKCSKYAAASATQCIAAASGVNNLGENNISQTELNAECRSIVKCIPNLVSGIKGTISQPDNATVQLNLINAAEHFLQPGAAVVKAAKSVLPTITDKATAMQLNDSSQQLGIALTDLRAAVNRAKEACSGLELDVAEERIANFKIDLTDLLISLPQLNLKPLPGETTESTISKLGSVVKLVEFTVMQLISAAKHGNEAYIGSAAREVANALKDLIDATRGVAATLNQPHLQNNIFKAAKDVIEKCICMLQEIRRILKYSNDSNDSTDLTIVAKDISCSLNDCISCLPGQTDIDEAVRAIDKVRLRLVTEEFPPSSQNYRQLQSNLSCGAKNLHEASFIIGTSTGKPTILVDSLKAFVQSHEEVIETGLQISGQTSNETRFQIINSLQNISKICLKFLSFTKVIVADPEAPNSKNQLSVTARTLTDCINQLLDICISAAPGQIDCENSIRNIESMLPLLDTPSEPVSDASYFDCLETVIGKSKSLGDGMTGIANFAKKSEYEQFSSAVKEVSSSICGLIEAAAQAAYLAGVGDSTSTAGKPGLIDQSYFFRATQSINLSCQSLESVSSSKQHILSAATVIAKHTSALCNICRLASSKTSNPVAKRHFVQSAKDIANSTAILVKEIKHLDANYSDINRAKCSSATKPLLDAVDNLCIFASSPEFISQPAKISPLARNSQEPIISAGRSIIAGSCAMILAAKSLAVAPKDPPTWQLLANHSKNVSDSIKSLVSSIRDKAPGQKECDSAIQKLTNKIRDLNITSLNALSQTLNSRKENTIQGFSDQMNNSISELRDRLDILPNAAKYEAEKIGHTITQVLLYCDSLVSGAIGSASHMIQSKQQATLLDQTKTVIECILQLIYATKECGGNPKAINIHNEIDDSVDSTKESLQELKNTLEMISISNGIVTGLIETINRAMVRLEDNRHSMMENVESFVDYQTSMVESVKEISRIAQDISNSSATDLEKLGPLAIDLSHKYTQLIQDSLGAIIVMTNSDVSAKLKMYIQELGKACIDIVKSAGSPEWASNEMHTKQIFDYSKLVNEIVSQILTVLQAESRGTQACINAVSTVSGIIGDLDTTIMFASAGTLHAENEDEKFADHRENILKTAKALVEDTKTLVAGAASSQEQLAVAAQNAITTIIQLAEVVKFGAASLGSNNPESQVMLINAVRDVASALGDLIHATKAASGKIINDPTMAHLKDSAKVMVTNVTSLLKTVKAVEDEHTRGTRALESTIAAIVQEAKTLNSTEQLKIKVIPEDIIRCAKIISTSTAKAVAAGNSCKQDDIIVAANISRKSISDMLSVCKGVAQSHIESNDFNHRMLQAGHDLSMNYRELLQVILQISTKQIDSKHLLLPVSRKISQSVTELVAIAEILRGNSCTNPEDPTVIAENELLGAAASIDAAAKKLASLRPRRITQEAKEELNFDEMILEAAKSIAAATSALIKAASSAQRELISTGKVSQTPLTSSDDGQWSEGLVSAARMVAAATHSLVESANSLIQGFSSEEKLISSAKQVASSTAQLLVACKVKADPESESTKRLQAAGNAVKRATDNLVRAAQQAIQNEEERSLILNRRIVGGIAQEINARSEVLRIEKELEEARGRLTAIRQAKYRNRTETSNNDDIEHSDCNVLHRCEIVPCVTQSLLFFTHHSHEQPHDPISEKNLKNPKRVDATENLFEENIENDECSYAISESCHNASLSYSESSSCATNQINK